VRGKVSRLGEPCPKVRLSQGRMPIEPFECRKLGEGEGTKLGEGEGSELGKPCPKVRLSQDRMPVEPFPSRIS
jgi:hypothetical protein